MWTLQASAFMVSNEGDDCQNVIEILLGHPKNGRGDPKQFVLSMVTNQCGIPIFAQVH
jgi:transposase